MMNLTCNNSACRIETFKGEIYPPMNSCPDCHTVAYTGAGVTMYPYAPSPIPDIRPIEVASDCVDETQQVLEAIADHLSLTASTRYGIAGTMDYAGMAFGMAGAWIRSIKIVDGEEGE
jgi:hypothetical protein